MNQPPPSGYGPQGYGQQPPPQQYGPPPQGYHPGYGPPPPQRSPLTTILAVIGGVVLLFFAGCLGMCAMAGKKISDDKAAKEKKYKEGDATKVSAKDLIEAYKKNEVAGDQKYKGEKLEVTGKIARIDSALGDEPVVHMSANGGELQFQTVMVKGLEKSVAAGLNKGDSLTVVCMGDGEIVGSPILDECSVK